jgi:hypothetical protein
MVYSPFRFLLGLSFTVNFYIYRKRVKNICYFKMERKQQRGNVFNGRNNQYPGSVDIATNFKWDNRLGMKHVNKKDGRIDIYNSEKLFQSIYATCLAVNIDKKDAAAIAKKVVAKLDNWLKTKNEVTSADLRHQAGKYLSQFDHHASYLYLHHHIVW